MFHPRGPSLAELARQALASTRRGYDLLAPKFDWTPFRTPAWLLDAVTPHLGEPGSVRSAVDLCCGTGAALPLLRALCRERVVGVDFSLGMLAAARAATRGADGERAAGDGGSVVARWAAGDGESVAARWAAAAGAGGPAPRLLLVQQDVLALGLGERFELATIFGALGHLRPAVQSRFLAAARSCLTPGGRLAFVTAPLPPPWSPALWLAAGFDAAIWLRNRLWRPPFVMYYLAWPLPRALRLLRQNGFTPELRPLALPHPLSRLRLVLARRE